MEELKLYNYCGHGQLMGTDTAPWQAVDEVLLRFGGDFTSAQSKYEIFVAEGIALGKRPDLVGGGLLRSAGGWEKIMAAHVTVNWSPS
jgi:hypothetical protein